MTTKQLGKFTVGSCPECDGGVRPSMIFAHSGVGTGEAGEFFGFLHFAWGAERAQLDTEQTRAFLESTGRIVEAAVTDSFLMTWATREVGVEHGGAAKLLLAFRTYREKMESKK